MRGYPQGMRDTWSTFFCVLKGKCCIFRVRADCFKAADDSATRGIPGKCPVLFLLVAISDKISRSNKRLLTKELLKICKISSLYKQKGIQVPHIYTLLCLSSSDAKYIHRPPYVYTHLQIPILQQKWKWIILFAFLFLHMELLFSCVEEEVRS